MPMRHMVIDPSTIKTSSIQPWLLVGALVAASVVKFLFVIFIFMHLRWDKAFCTVLFFIGLILAGGTMWALVQLFGAAASVPLSSP